MTSIEKLQLCGVRSFDPNPANQQSILFQKPLTVILGKNGAGKTTIIEALLNACTGSMPPGSGTEKSSFVYDPKVFGESEVKAQIRLIFTGKGGKLMQVIRSFQATRSRNKVNFTTLDNTVAYQDTSTGKVFSSTYRASDVDRVVPEMLGVSAAVLEHVIFCHQEDCNWPLGPPKDVKRIFDDIFAATRYVLALDRLRENSKEYRRQLKDHEASLLALREHRDQAKILEKQIDQKEERVRAVQHRNTNLDPELQKLRGAVKELGSIEESIEERQRELSRIHGRLEQRKEEMRRSGVPLPTESLKEMLKLRDKFRGQIEKAAKEVEECTESLKSLKAAHGKQQEELYRSGSALEGLEREERQHKENCARLREALSAFSDEQIVGESGVDSTALGRATAKAKECVRAAKENLREAVEDIKSTVQTETNAMYELKGIIASEEKEKALAQREITDLKGKMQQYKDQIRQCGGNKRHDQQADAKGRVKELEQRVQAAEELRKRGNSASRAAQVRKDVDQKSADVARLTERLMLLQQHEGEESSITELKSRIDEDVVALDRALGEQVLPQLIAAGVLKKALEANGTTMAQLNTKVVAARQKAIESEHAAQAEVSDVDRQIAGMEQRCSLLRQEETECEAKLASGLQQCGGTVKDVDQYENVLRQAKVESAECAKKTHALEALSSCYHEFVQQAEKDNKCSVCDRAFENRGARTHFIKVNHDRQRAAPEALAAAKGAAAESEAAYQQLEALRVVVGSVRQCKLRLPQIREELHTLATGIDKLTSRSTVCNDSLEEARHRRESLDAAAQHISSLRLVEDRINSSRSKLAEKEKALAERRKKSTKGPTAGANNDGDNRSYAELCTQYAAQTKELHHLQSQLKEAQRLEDGQSDSQPVRELAEAKEEMHKIEVDVNTMTQLEVRISEAEGKCSTLSARIKEIDKHAMELEKAVTEHRKRITELEKKLRSAEEKERSNIETAEGRLRALEVAAPPVRGYLQSKGSEKLQQLRKSTKEVGDQCSKMQSEVDALTRKLEEAQRTVNDQHSRRAEMDAAVEALQRQAQNDEDEDQIAQLERELEEAKGSKLHGLDDLIDTEAASLSLTMLRQALGQKITELERQQAQQEGNVEAMLLDLSQLKAQMNAEKYQNIEKRYRSTFLKVQTTEISIKDIEKYYSALEKAVQSYHQEKIEQINQIIADLWRQTYRGSDIDTVEIHSETESSTTSTSRRSYNYRVVMKRGNNEIDMRGRCSAGQKVLASVIIRLALSEAFCCDCGILALDEPTTNLDEDNARSLAEALSKLIDSRRAVKHFQLIVITHDEQFVRALGGQSLDKFYYVHKDREGAFSVIDERTFDQLFA